MKSTTVEDEIAEIERSARSGAGAPLPPSDPPRSSAGQSSHHRGTSPSPTEGSAEEGSLLVGFPPRSAPAPSSQTMNPQYGVGHGAPSGKARQRNSVSLNPLSMRGALAGLSDLVDDSDDDEKAAPAPQPANPKASGGPDHRPLVGGFAAAAYEAARVDHYKKQGVEVRGHPPPRPRYNHNYPGGVA